MRPRIGIVGGGLSGLYAARLLDRRGCDPVLFEARDRLGGRLLSETLPAGSGSGAAAAFDLGATWIWPQVQPDLHALMHELGLTLVPQFESGDVLVEGGQGGAIQRVGGLSGATPSVRVLGGMRALVDALRDGLSRDEVVEGARVSRIERTDEGVEIAGTDLAGRPFAAAVDRVLLAVPPRLAVRSMDFVPALPGEVVDAWGRTATWMAPHAKYMAVYPEPFWRGLRLSGSARSQRGPLAEIHDASVPDGPAALFGFLGVSAFHRSRVREDVLRELCRKQLVRLFGSRAAVPVAEWIKDWARDPLTATDHDQMQVGGHPWTSVSGASHGPWKDRLTGIASEWSPQFPGVVAGAVDAAARGVRAALGPLMQEIR